MDSLLPLAVSALVVVAITIALRPQTFAFGDAIAGFERIGPDPGLFSLNLAAARKTFSKEGYKILLSAYRKSADKNYVVQTEDMPRIILSPRFLPELDMLPETTLSHRQSIDLRHLGRYSGMNIVLQSHLHSDICRVHLRRNLPQMLPDMANKVNEAMSQFLSQTNNKDFSQVSAMGYSFSVIARIFSYVFVGEPLCDDKEWMQAIEQYPRVMMSVSASLRPWHPYLRPLIAPFIQSRKNLKAYQDKLHILFDPVFDVRRNDRNHRDFLQWLINLAAPHEADNHSILLKLMFLTLAAIHTSAMAIDHMMLDLCAHPEYVNTLREEIKEAVSPTGGSWTFETLSRLPKLDSFMQESRRVNQPAALAFHRLTLKDVKLSNGTTIPKGWVVSMPAEAMSQDPNYYENPDQFDGHRFLDAGKNGESNFSSILPGNLSWGHGRFTCPGRWYADAQIKLVLGKTIERYDFRFPGGNTERPQNIHIDERITPDPRAMIEMKIIDA